MSLPKPANLLAATGRRTAVDKMRTEGFQGKVSLRTSLLQVPGGTYTLLVCLADEQGEAEYGKAEGLPSVARAWHMLLELADLVGIERTNLFLMVDHAMSPAAQWPTQ